MARKYYNTLKRQVKQRMDERKKRLASKLEYEQGLQKRAEKRHKVKLKQEQEVKVEQSYWLQSKSEDSYNWVKAVPDTLFLEQLNGNVEKSSKN